MPEYKKMRNKNDHNDVVYVYAEHGEHLWIADVEKPDSPATDFASFYEELPARVPQVGESWSYHPDSGIKWLVTNVTDTHWEFMMVKSRRDWTLPQEDGEQTTRITLYRRTLPETQMKPVDE